MNKSKLWHLVLMVGGALAVLAPDLTSLAAWLGGLGVGWLAWVARGLGILALIGSRWDIIRAKLEKLGPSSPGTPVVCLLALGSLLLAGQARADTPISKCWSSVCIGPQVAATTFTLRLDTKALSAQIPTGAAGYGFNLPSGYLSGGMFLTGQLGTKATPQFIGAALLLTIMRAVVVGPVYHYGDDAEWFGVALGGSLTSTFGLEAPTK